MKDVPFIFISDSNPEALTLFANLKYGSMGLAHLSHTMSCPRLRYGGSTLTDLEELMDNYPARRLAASANRGSWSEQEKERHMKMWKREATGIIRRVKSDVIPPTRRTRLVGLQNRRLFDDPVDVTGKEELLRMLEPGSCVSPILIVTVFVEVY